MMKGMFHGLPPLVVALLLCHCASTKPEGAGVEEQRAFVDREVAAILQKLEQTVPGSAKELEESEGYAVFKYVAGKMPLVLGGLGAGSGFGAAIDEVDRRRTYMKVQKVNWGWGMGVKETSVVFIFEDRSLFDDFRRGKWDGGMAAEATLKSDERGTEVGGAASLQKGFTAYTLTDSGVSYGVTYRARRFSPVASMNR